MCVRVLKNGTQRPIQRSPTSPQQTVNIQSRTSACSTSQSSCSKSTDKAHSRAGETRFCARYITDQRTTLRDIAATSPGRAEMRVQTNDPAKYSELAQKESWGYLTAITPLFVQVQSRANRAYSMQARIRERSRRLAQLLIDKGC